MIMNDEWKMEKRVKKRSKYQQSGTKTKEQTRKKIKRTCFWLLVPPLTNHRRPLSLTLTPHILPFTFTPTLTLTLTVTHTQFISTVHTPHFILLLLHSFSSVPRSDSSSLGDGLSGDKKGRKSAQSTLNRSPMIY